MPSKPRNAFKVIGETGLKQQDGLILEEFNIELQGQRGREALQRMADTDPVISGVLFAIDMLIRQVEWPIQPYDESSESADQAQFVEEAFDDLSIPWSDTVSEILSKLVHGFSLFETLYKYRIGPEQTNPLRRSRYTDGRIGWRKFSPRAQESVYRWVFDDEGGISGVLQLGYNQWNPVFIPIEKLLLFRTTTQKGNPEGVSSLRSAYIAYYYQRNIQRIEAIGIERDLAGLPVMDVPSKWMGDDALDWQRDIIDDCQNLVTNIRQDEQAGVLIPQSFDEHGNPLFNLRLLTTGGARQHDVDKIITRYDQRKAMALLADFILLGHENIGSMALSETKVGLFMTALKAWVNSIADVMNNHAIPRLLRLNGIPAHTPPRMEPSDIEDIDVSQVVDAITKLAQVGMVGPSEELERFLLEKMGVPYQEPDERLIPEDVRQRTPGQEAPEEEDVGSEEESDDPEDNQ